MWHLLIFGAVVLGIHPGACTDVVAVSNEGQRFAFALPPAYVDVDSELIFLSKESVTVTVRFPNSVVEEVDVEADTVSHFSLAGLIARTIVDVEDKGVVISAPSPISVHLANSETTDVRNPDATILRPIDADDTDDIFLMTYSPGSSSGNEQWSPKNFFMVVAAANSGATDVEVWSFADGDYTLELETTLFANQVLTADDWEVGGGQERDYTGTMIRSTQPVAVYAGHGCALLPSTVDNSQSRYVFDSMPRSSEYGTSFSTMSLHFGEQGGYVMRVLSVADGTTIMIPAVGINDVFDQGEFVEWTVPPNRQGALITCSEPCIAAQFPNQVGSGDSPGGRHMNPFMAILTNTDLYSSDVVFSSPSNTDDTVLGMSVIVDFFPVEDLYLDGENLELDWQAIAGSTDFFHATMDVDPGQHNLYTMDPDHRFAAYLYGSHSEETLTGRSWGYSIGYGGSEDGGNSTSSIYW